MGDGLGLCDGDFVGDGVCVDEADGVPEEFVVVFCGRIGDDDGVGCRGDGVVWVGDGFPVLLPVVSGEVDAVVGVLLDVDGVCVDFTDGLRVLPETSA